MLGSDLDSRSRSGSARRSATLWRWGHGLAALGAGDYPDASPYHLRFIGATQRRFRPRTRQPRHTSVAGGAPAPCQPSQGGQQPVYLRSAAAASSRLSSAWRRAPAAAGACGLPPPPAATSKVCTLALPPSECGRCRGSWRIRRSGATACWRLMVLPSSACRRRSRCPSGMVRARGQAEAGWGQGGAGQQSTGMGLECRLLRLRK